jgi:tetratricopeptide (TPR) repeat protein
MRIAPLRAWQFTFVFLLLFPMAAFPIATFGQEELIQEGNLRYQNEDYQGALEAYKSVLEAGYEGGDLYYNLGNAYFKTGDLGHSILNYERALRLLPRNPDVRANLELARSLTADEIEPLPRFWVFGVISWWVSLIPRGILILIVVACYLAVFGSLLVRILARQPGPGRAAVWVLVGAALALVFFGTTLLARERVLGASEWGIIMVEEVPVQSAPSDEDDLTLFRIHEGTKVRLDQRTELWSEVVLEDGKVGWVPSEALEII